ncbi:hypothetical protein LSH36_626g04009 [Paralvinella palmiformis]|uniref:Uncharacterized protein n=1 Tax=Paralvinella palmiformis TaxID=53620 RepID=A0AAD9MUR1_9ANNE|nr:hypothetical protein LSH36_626g04009 [Paralvinella palmiformis]
MFVKECLSTMCPRSISPFNLSYTEQLNIRKTTTFEQYEKLRGHNNNHPQGVTRVSCDQDVSTDKCSPDRDSRDLPHQITSLLQELKSEPSKENCECLAQLMQYLYGLVCITSNQLTEVERLRAQLTEANNKVSTLYAENKRLSHGYHHDKQLEILREQQESLRQERTQLDRLREFDRKERDEERAKIRKEKEDVEKEKAELQSQKEEIQRQKEILQRQMDLFEENKRRLLQQTFEIPRNLSMRERSESPTSRGVSPSSRGSQSSLLDVSSHVRSGSDDVGHGQSPDRVVEPGSGASPLPIHLLSATNEQKLGSVLQQLPLKFAIQGGGAKLPQSQSSPTTTTPSGGGAGKQQSPSGVQQMLPLKLSTSSLSSAASGLSKSATLDGGTRPLMHSQSQRPLASVSRTGSGTRVPPGAASLGTNPGNILPMKLAEKPRPKSASSATNPAISSHHGTPSGDKSHSHKRSSSGTKKEEEVIYF